jgi:transcriptional regulator with XRE-family HTH domain
MNEFAARLKLAMKAQQITQAGLAAKIGITQSSISLLTRGEANPSDRTVRDICGALRINETWLRTGEGPMEIETPDTLAAMLAEQYGLSPYAARVINALAHAAAELSEDQFARLAGIVIAEMKKGAPAEDEHIPAERAEALTEAVSPDRADRNEAE